MKSSTKDKIINKAIELFNEKGFASVSIVDIGTALGMTRGNVAYHFQNKEALLKAIAQELWVKLKGEKQKARALPSFENIHNELQVLYKLQLEYSFIFLNIHVLNDPIIAHDYRRIIDQIIDDFVAAITFSIGLGNMRPEPYPGMYYNLAHNSWMITFFWINQQAVRGTTPSPDNNEAEKKLWSMLLPHFTGKGIKAFRNYFGEKYLAELGKSFSSEMSDYVHF